MMTPDEIIEIANAIKAGKAIEVCAITTDEKANWHDYEGKGNLNTYDCYYRVKPKPLECWVNVSLGGALYVHASQGSALTANDGRYARVAVHMREVV